MTHWSEPYVGLPWAETGDAPDGVSCWGLCVLVYREVLGIALPTYAGLCACPAERRQIAAAIGGEASGALWVPVPITAAREFDVAVFRVGELDAHVGLVCAQDRMLHITQGHDSAVLDMRAARWASRFAGLYRHAEMMDRTGG
ncbi:NlpC/P60 family protein [Methylobacterium sp. 17Sr1-1]|uniref:NlpC/P60 family protein n=1 Tax=Methylobacterium sp. 17Sr1-1 TaxID=2202826 RepID=UPI0013A538C2|nr:NlpC/P60 family protein [Methylobacterium sp. 17Sr1-1]